MAQARGQMAGVVLGAVRTRTSQALTVLILTMLAAGVAAAGPWYGLAVASRSATAAVEAAPAARRVLSTTQVGDTGGNPQSTLDAFRLKVGDLLPIAGATPALGLTQSMLYIDPSRGDTASGFAVDYRDGFCSHVRLTGGCPTGSGQAAITRDTAQRLEVGVGDPFTVRASRSSPPVGFRVVALYDLAEPNGAYWSNPLYGNNGQLDPLFTGVGTFTDRQLWQPTVTFDLEVPRGQLRGDRGFDLNRLLDRAQTSFNEAQLKLSDPTGPLIDAVRRGRETILRGVLVALAQVLVLAWFAIGLAGRYTGRERRADAALLKLRGNTRFSMLRLTLGQHLVPLLGGAILGGALGLLAAWALARTLPVRAELPLALGLSAAAVAVVLAGAIVVLTVVDAVVLRQPVAMLLRRVPAGRRDWRADVVDLALVALAAGAVYQARTGGPDRGLGLVAPALLALAVALLLARLLRTVADRAGGVAVRTGRLRFGLTAVRVSRQPGTDRVFALIVVAVSMFALAVGGFAAGRTERAERADVELGAARVLTVRAATRTQLQYAVRQADPGGRYAMAAVVDPTNVPPVLAVDSSRLAAVARWRPEYGPIGALPAAGSAAHLPADLPRITGAKLTVRMRNDRALPAELDAILLNEATGAPTTVRFRGVPPGEHEVSTPVTGCDPGPGCRFVRWQLVTPSTSDGRGPVPGAVTVTSLAQSGPDATILDAAQLADVHRWYPDFSNAALQVSATPAGLSMEAPGAAGVPIGDRVFVADAPLPLPVVLAGPPSTTWQFEDPASSGFGLGLVPVRVAATARVLPVLGTTGMMVDLDMARRIGADADRGGSMQVWLAADAPPSVVPALRAAGLTILTDRSATRRAGQLAADGPVVVGRFTLLTVLIGLLLAAATIAVTAAVERDPLTEQLQALRTQGLARRAAVLTAYAGTAGLVVAGLAGGLLAAVTAGPAAAVVAPPFTDRWAVVAPPGALSGAALAVALLVALVVLGVTGWFSIRPLVRRLRGGTR